MNAIVLTYNGYVPWHVSLGYRPGRIGFYTTVKELLDSIEYNHEPLKNYSLLTFATQIQDERAEAIQKRLMQECPFLFSPITVQIGNVSRAIPRGSLMMQSEKFRTMLSGSWQESRDLQITLPETTAANDFLGFLATGKIDLQGDDAANRAIALAILAKEHLCPVLGKSCTAFLKENLEITDKTVYDYYKLGLTHELPKFIKLCRRHLEKVKKLDVGMLYDMAHHFQDYTIAAHCNEMILESNNYTYMEEVCRSAVIKRDSNIRWYAVMLANSMLQGRGSLKKEIWDTDIVREYIGELIQSSAPPTSMLLELARSCTSFALRPNFNNNKRGLSVSRLNLRQGLYPFLTHLDEQLSIQSLEISGDDPYMHPELAKRLPYVTNLNTSDCHYTVIPVPWVNHINEIAIFGNKAIRHLLLPSAEKVTLWFCEKLESLIAPNAKIVHVTQKSSIRLTLPYDCHIMKPDYTVVELNLIDRLNKVTLSPEVPEL